MSALDREGVSARKFAIMLAAILFAATEAPADPKKGDHEAHHAAPSHRHHEAHGIEPKHRHHEAHRTDPKHGHHEARYTDSKHAHREAHRTDSKHRHREVSHGTAHARTRNWDRSTGNSTSLAGYPEPLVKKVEELKNACNAKVISSYRPGSVMCDRGRCILSNHALKKAADVTGKPACLYAHLRHWEGGYSTDYAAVQHVHISYNRHSPEWGIRFTHHGGRAVAKAANGPTAPSNGVGFSSTHGEAARASETAVARKF